MERLRASVSQTKFTYDETSVDVTVSIGVTSTERLEFISTDTLLQQADICMKQKNRAETE